MTHNINKGNNINRNFGLGAKVEEKGVLFSIFSRNASKVWIVLLKDKDNEKPDHTIELNSTINKTGDIWHIFVEGITEGWYYLWKMDGDYNPQTGLLFNPDALLIDPYAKALTGKINSHPEEKNDSSIKYYSDYNKIAKGIICSDNFDWQGDRQLNIPWEKTIIYEMHLRGFTVSESAGVKNPGTYSGLINKIPYLKELGITAIELLPVNEFSLYADNRKKEITDEVLNNYWGYNTLGFFAPNSSYAAK